MTDEKKTTYIHDGIEELQRPLPKWWKIAFAICAGTIPCYMIYFHGGAEGRSMVDYYDAAFAENVRLQFAEMGELRADEATILRSAANPSWVRVGKVVFKTHCVSCHGPEAEGKVGPNLTDDSFKHVQKIEDIAKVIIEGANNNAMPAWQKKLHPNEIVLVSAYVASLRGTNVSGGKAAEGNSIAPWPEPPPEQPKSEDI